MAGTYHEFSGTPSSLEGGAAFYTLPTAVTLNAGAYAIIGANFGSANPYWSASGTHTDINKVATFGGGPYLTMGAVFGANTDRGLFINGATLPPNFSGGTLVNYGANLFGGNPGTPSFAGATFDFTPRARSHSLWCCCHWLTRAVVCWPICPTAAHGKCVLRDDDKDLDGAAKQSRPFCWI